MVDLRMKFKPSGSVPTCTFALFYKIRGGRLLPDFLIKMLFFTGYTCICNKIEKALNDTRCKVSLHSSSTPAFWFPTADTTTVTIPTYPTNRSLNILNSTQSTFFVKTAAYLICHSVLFVFLAFLT